MPIDKLNIQSVAAAANKRIETLYSQGHYQEALDICLHLMHTYGNMVDVSKPAAINCLHLRRWQEAIGYAQAQLERDRTGSTFGYDMLALAYGQLGQWDEARRYGLQALNMRARYLNSEPVIPLPNLLPMPPLPSARTRERNVIAFSLFGDNPKYCETAVLNVQEQPSIYPYWVCRFYVDGSVPGHVIKRLRAGDAQIVQVDGPAAQWPGEMWRFLALDDSLAHRILFRDADSVISGREAGAVEQWLTSGKRFHMMRDDGSHAELIQAGLWGVVAGSLPPLQELMRRFLSAPLPSKHWADQHFLRQYVWPYARTSLMQHDSVFGFMDAVPFPDGDRPKDFFVGKMESVEVSFAVKGKQPDGSEVSWKLYRIVEKFGDDRVQAELICAYTNTVHDGAVKAHIPAHYLQWIEQGTVQVHLVENNTA
jgi:hypothetical protein